MQSCPKCKITIRGHKACCPLCQGKLKGEPEGDPFPVIPQPKVSSISFVRICTFILVALLLVMRLVRYLAGPLAWTTILSIAGILAWADLIVISWFRNNVMKTVVVQLYLMILITVILDARTGMHGWSVAWVLPVTFVAMAVATTIIGGVMHMPLESYVMYLFWNVLLSLLQVIALINGTNPFPVPAVISMLLLILLGAAVVIFRLDDLKHAANKWFNL